MEEKRSSAKARNTSIDIAKSVSFFGMAIMAYILAFRGGDALQSLPMNVFHGKFAGSLIFLFGASYFLMVKKYIRYGSIPKLTKIRNQVIYRGIFYILLGSLLFSFWPFDILHYYGIFILIGIIFMSAQKIVLWSIALLLIAGFAIVFGALDFPADWYELTNVPTRLFSPRFQLSNIFYQGKFSILPYGAFFILGIWYGGLTLTKSAVHLFIFRLAFPVFIIIELGSAIFQNYIPMLNIGDLEWLVRILTSTRSNPPLPLFVISTLAFSFSLVSGFNILKEKYDGSTLLKIFERAGRMIFTLLVFQALAGIAVQYIFFDHTLQSIGFLVTFNILFVILSLLIVLLISRSNRRGPIEGLMRSFTGYKKR